MTDRDIFMNAPAGASPEVLEAYLDKMCGEDAELRRKVEALIAAGEEADPEFLEKGPLEEQRRALALGLATDSTEATLREEAPLAEGTGDTIGNYKLLQKIGEGGFGVVYMADQLKPVKRRVAFKLIKLGMDTKQVVARFEAERQALALMDHPNIAKVHDAGSTETGRPFFVMELVKGIPITTFCDEQNLSTGERLALYIDVCRAVQHAHQKGVIHRDLKPSNVMVTMHDDKAVPKVIDFGVAKATQTELTDKTLYTRYEQFIGTPAYMSPEQAQLSGLDIDTRSDVYALGVLLYELLTGRTPFDSKELLSAGYDEIRRIIREEEPPKPSTRVGTLENAELTDLAKHRNSEPQKLRSLMRGDLDWIVMKALEKDRTRRYETANALALDVQRHLDDEPVVAAAPSTAYRIAKYTRRHRTAIGVAAVIATLLVAGSLISTWLAVSANRAKKGEEIQRIEAEKQEGIARAAEGVAARAQGEAEAARDQAREKEVIAKLQFAEELLSSGESYRGVAHLASILREDRSNRVAASRLLSALTMREWPQQLVGDLRVEHPSNFYPDAVFSPDGTLVAEAGVDGRVHLWNAETGQPFGSPLHSPDNDHGFVELRFSPDGRFLAGASPQCLIVWDVRSGARQLVRTETARPEVFLILDFSPDSKWILSGGQMGAWVLNLETGAMLKHEDLQTVYGGEINSGKFSEDGRMVVTGSSNRIVDLWAVDLERSTVEPLANLEHSGGIWAVDLSGDGRRLVVGTHDRSAHLWSLPDFEAEPGAQPERIGGPLLHGARVHQVEFSPDTGGGRILTASHDGTARVWDAATGDPVTEPLEHGGIVRTASFNHNGSRVVTGAEDGTAQVWDVETGQKIGEPLRHSVLVFRAEFSSDGEKLLTAGGDGSVRVWRTPRGQPQSMVFRHRFMPQWVRQGGAVYDSDFSADSSLLITAARDGYPKIWDLRTGWALATLPHTGDVNQCHFSPDGGRAVSASHYGSMGQLRLWDITRKESPSGTPVVSAWARSLEHSGSPWFSPGGAPYLKSRSGNMVRVHHAATGIAVAEMEHPAKVVRSRFSQDGEYILTACKDGKIRAWTLEGKIEAEFEPGGAMRFTSFSVSPDGPPRLTTWAQDGVRVWDATLPSVAFGKQPLHVLPTGADVYRIKFSRDGRYIVTARLDGIVQLWDVEAGNRVGAPMHHDNMVETLAFCPSGTRLATASSTGEGRVWDIPSGLPISEPLHHDDLCVFTWFSPDGRKLVTTGFDATARVWDLPPVTLPVPEWFVGWAESVAGMRLNSEGVASPVSWREREELRRDVTGLAKDDYQRWAEWFHLPIDDRPLTPFSPLRLSEYLEQRVSEESAAGLKEAARLSDEWAGELGRMARRLRELEPQTGTWMSDFHGKRLTILDELIALSTRMFGEESRGCLALWVEAGKTRVATEQWAEAREAFLVALDLHRKVAGEDPLGSARILGDLAHCDRWLKEHDKALENRQRQVALLTGVLGDAGETWEAMSELVRDLERVGRHTDALAMRERVIDMKSKVLGVDDPSTLDSLALVANKLRARKQFERAIEVCQKVIDGRTRVLSPDHRRTLESTHQLAWILREAMRFGEGLEVARKLEVRCREALGAEDLLTARAKIEEAHSLHALGEFQEAIEKRKEIIAVRKSQGETDRLLLAVMLRLSDSHARLGEHQKALTIRKDVAELRSGSLGPWHVDTKAARARVVQSMAALGRHDELRAQFDKYLEGLRNGEARLSELNAVVAAFHAGGRTEDALEMQLALAEVPTLDGQTARQALRQVARYAVAIGEWETGASALERAITTPGDEGNVSMDEMRLAALILASGDLREFEDYTDGWLKRYVDAEGPLVPDRVAKCYFAIERNEGDELEALAAKLAQRTESPEAPDWFAPWGALCRGIAEYRTGKDTKALKSLAVAQTGAAPCKAAAHAYAAMAAFSHGDSARAKAELENARTANAPVLDPGQGDLGPSWHDRIIALAALREAERMIQSEELVQP